MLNVRCQLLVTSWQMSDSPTISIYQYVQDDELHNDVDHFMMWMYGICNHAYIMELSQTMISIDALYVMYMWDDKWG